MAPLMAPLAPADRFPLRRRIHPDFPCPGAETEPIAPVPTPPQRPVPLPEWVERMHRGHIPRGVEQGR